MGDGAGRVTGSRRRVLQAAQAGEKGGGGPAHLMPSTSVCSISSTRAICWLHQGRTHGHEASEACSTAAPSGPRCAAATCARTHHHMPLPRRRRRTAYLATSRVARYSSMAPPISRSPAISAACPSRAASTSLNLKGWGQGGADGAAAWGLSGGWEDSTVRRHLGQSTTGSGATLAGRPSTHLRSSSASPRVMRVRPAGVSAATSRMRTFDCLVWWGEELGLVCVCRIRQAGARGSQRCSHGGCCLMRCPSLLLPDTPHTHQGPGRRRRGGGRHVGGLLPVA